MANELALVEVDFHGDMIQAAQDGEGQVWVPIRRICENLGVELERQRRKLRDAKWATTGIMPVVAEDGKIREIACVSLKSLPMWLVKIEPSRVNPEIREKLERYQLEAAEVLARHFLGEPVGSQASRQRHGLGEGDIERIGDYLLDRLTPTIQAIAVQGQAKVVAEPRKSLRSLCEDLLYDPTPKQLQAIRQTVYVELVNRNLDLPVRAGMAPAAELLYPESQWALAYGLIREVMQRDERRLAGQSQQQRLF